MIKGIECINTFQGEGPQRGYRMLLFRFKYCDRVENKNPCKYCDTLVKMRVQQEAEYSIDLLQKIIDKEKIGILITGGEPAYGDQYYSTIEMLTKLNYPYANVETNGHRLKDLLDVVPKIHPVKFIYSPKFFTEEELDAEIERTPYVFHDPRVIVKLVYQNNILVHDYLYFLKENEMNWKVFLMPEGTTREKIIENAAETFDAAEKYKVGFSSRDHIIYGFV